MRIVIIEDDPHLGKLLDEYLHHLGHEKVRLCVSGREARLAMEQETFDCAFIDLKLPDINGLELLEEFKRRDPRLPVVMMSGFPTMHATIEAMQKGASDFLTKPFTMQNVVLALERITKERTLLMENLGLLMECEARKELQLVNLELEEKIREQFKLFEISTEIDEARSSEDLYPCIVRLASGLGSIVKAGFFVLPRGQRSVVRMAEHGPGVNGSSPSIFSIPDDSLRKVFLDDAGHFFLPRHKVEAHSPLPGDFAVEGSALSCWPVRIRGELFGFLAACHNGGNSSLPPTDMKLLDFLVKKSALAIENMALYESLIANFYGILRSLVNALEAKDPYTGKHSERVTRYAISIGRKMGLSGTQVESLNTICHLHDIGKIGIRDNILNKTGALTVEEYELIKQHPVIGETIVAELGLSAEERAIIRYHHERWNGEGYPDGLSRDEIPLLARIVAVADAFDAMTTKRAYREGMSRYEAVLELQRHSGTQFDPAVIDAFLETIRTKA